MKRNQFSRFKSGERELDVQQFCEVVRKDHRFHLSYCLSSTGIGRHEES
jgi:hypothetical protein